LQEAKDLVEKLKQIKNVTKIDLGSVGPVLGVHTGPGLVGLAMVKEPFYQL